VDEVGGLRLVVRVIGWEDTADLPCARIRRLGDSQCAAAMASRDGWHMQRPFQVRRLPALVIVRPACRASSYIPEDLPQDAAGELSLQQLSTSSSKSARPGISAS
jgi:hypothetical protein